MPLPAVSQISYNGFTFPTPMVKSRVRIEPKWDDADRTISYNVYTLEVEAIIAGDALAVGQTLTGIRQLLTKPAGLLIIADTGLGSPAEVIVNLTINGTDADVMWGPKPRLLTWEPIGSNLAVRIVWVCQFAKSDCVLIAPVNQFSALNYETRWGINGAGLTRRTISGFAEIPINRAGSGVRIVSRAADQIRAQIQPTVPLGFKRTSQDWILSANRTKLSFTITDEEIASDNPYFPGVHEIEIEHNVAASISTTLGLNRWQGRFSGTILLDKFQSKDAAWLMFLFVIRQRFLKMIEFEETVLLTGLEFNEQIFGKRVRFSLSYLHTTDLNDILSRSGLFQPVSGTSWGQYRASLENTAWSQRGHAGLRFQPGLDVIVDLCGGTGQLLAEDANQGLASQPREQLLGVPCPDPEHSWFLYDANIAVSAEHGTISHTLMRDSTLALEAQIGLKSGDLQQRAWPPELRSSPNHFALQQSAGPTALIMFTGRAIRVGKKIPRPKLTIPGVSIAPRPRFYLFDQKVLGHLGRGCPIHEARWWIEYDVDGPINRDDIPSVPNHAIGIPFDAPDPPAGASGQEPITGLTGGIS